MKTSALLIACIFAAPLAPAFAVGPEDPRAALARELKQRIADQLKRNATAETLRQSHDQPQQAPPAAQVFIVRLGEGIEVVSESQSEDGVVTQKDYFLHESRVYAHCIARREPGLDGKSERVSESWFLFEKGAPFYRSGRTFRVPANPKTPAEDREMPLPPGLEGWGHKLTAHAFDIARTFRAGVGRYTFGMWDEWLLKNAPPAGAGDPPVRGADWLPAPETLVLPVRDTTSPDGLFSIGWGYEKGSVDWRKLASPDGDSVSFSTVLPDGPLPDGLEDDATFLLHHLTGKPLCKLAIEHPGERQRFNHDELLAHWSPSSRCVVIVADAKWESTAAQIAWIKDGQCEGAHDILEPLQKAVARAVRNSKHPAAKRLREDGEAHRYRLSKILVEDDGAFAARVTGEIPKDDRPGGFFAVIVEGKFSPERSGDPAILKTTKIKVLPPEN